MTTARTELFESMTPANGYPAPGEAEAVNALLDAYRAEVLREAATAITERCTHSAAWHCPRHKEADKLRRMADAAERD